MPGKTATSMFYILNKPKIKPRIPVSLPDLCTNPALGSFVLYYVTFAGIVIHL